MKSILPKLVGLACMGAVLVGLPGSARAGGTMVGFGPGTLIIPMQSTFQTETGMVSAYGLVYRILQSNAAGHANASSPITVNIANNDSKSSPNRCVPTNNAVFNSGVASPTSLSGAGSWNDGCDFSVTGSATQQPVVPVDFSVGYPGGSHIYNTAAIPTFDDPDAWPRYKWTAALTGSSFTQINYSGAAFIIDSSFAQQVINLIKNGDSGPNALPQPAYRLFSGTTASTQQAPTAQCGKAFICPGGASCGNNQSLSTNIGLVGGGPPNFTLDQGCHYVNIHQATVNFSANIDRAMNVSPPIFALVEFPNSSDPRKGYGVLENYLMISGLYVTGTNNGQDSLGCPLGNISGCSLNGTTPVAVGTEATNVNHGNIADDFLSAYPTANSNDIDHSSSNYPNGILAQLNGIGKPYYDLVWIPHWQATDDSSGNDNVGLASVGNAVNNGMNLLTECFSIDSDEDGQTGVTGGATAGTDFMFVTNSSGSGIANYGYNYTYGPAHNCSDPGGPSNCATYANPTLLLSQVGDWEYNMITGSTEVWAPAAGYGCTPGTAGCYQSWTKPLIQATNFTGGGASGADAFNYGEASKGTGSVVYVGGHDVSTDAQGSRVVLNSMLNLSAVPVVNERGVAAPVSVPGTDIVLSATYDAYKSGTPSGDQVTYTFNGDGSGGKDWMFPVNTGHLRALCLGTNCPGSSATALASGQTQYGNTGSAVMWDSDSEMPAPTARNLFTYLGGAFGTTASNPNVPGYGNVVSTSRQNLAQWTGAGVLQGAWLPEAIAPTNIAACNTGNKCLNILAATGTQFGLGANGFCDLEEELLGAAYSCPLGEPHCFNSGQDDKTCTANNSQALDKMLPDFEEIIARVRGSCYSMDANNDCDADPDGITFAPVRACQCVQWGDTQSDNRAHMGAVVHSTPAVVGPSSNFTDVGGGRPTVAYVGALDGELHAFYIEGGGGYQGPPSPFTLPNPDATVGGNNNQGSYSAAYGTGEGADIFRTDWAASNTFQSAPTAALPGASGLPQAGTELWAFMPASQIGHLQDNTQSLDTSPQVQDVFADFTGTGQREWHTVLTMSLGTPYSEVFAMDVTNPLKPALLWDLTGSPTPDTAAGNGNPTLFLANGAQGLASPTVYKWPEESSTFVVGSANPLNAYVYDYSDVGAATAVTSGQTRAGLEPLYADFLSASSATASNGGLEVYGMDSVTGQKLWQFEEPYSTCGATSPCPGTFPTTMSSKTGEPPPAYVYSTTNGAQEVLAGDLQGRIWEINVFTGQNLNINPTAGGAPFGLPLVDDGSSAATEMPISTNLILLPFTNSGSTIFTSALSGSNLLIYGTGGEDWVTSGEGTVHFALFDQRWRAPYASTATGALANPVPGSTPVSETGGAGWATYAKTHSTTSVSGVLFDVPGSEITLPAGELVYGQIVAAGADVFFQTANAPWTLNNSGTAGGHEYTQDVGTATTPTASSLVVNGSSTSAATYGGAAPINVDGSVHLISDEVSTINNITLSATQKTGSQAPVPQAKGPIDVLIGYITRFF